MAVRLRLPLEKDDLKKLTVTNVRKKYEELAMDYNKLINLDYVYCCRCGEWKSETNFYHTNTTKSGLQHCACKECLYKMATIEVDKRTHERKDDRDKCIETLRLLDLPFIEETYQAQLNLIQEQTGQKRNTAWSQYITMLQSLPNWKGLTFKDSVFAVDDLENNTEENTRIIQKTLKTGRKRFGNNYSDEDLMFLENEYQDWIHRYSVDSKSQEILFKRICCKELEIDQAQKNGKDTKEMDKTLQDLMSSLSIKPSQNNSNSLTESLTFGQLIEKWENEEPIPKPDPEFEDVDRIGKLIRVWFTGHLRRILGLDGGYNKEYDEYVAQYTVEKPTYAGVDEEGGTNDVYAKLFGKEE